MERRVLCYFKTRTKFMRTGILRKNEKNIPRVKRALTFSDTISALPMCQTSIQTSASLADELSAATGSTSARPHLVLRKCHPRLRHEDSSPDSERMATDSGHSTAHSPDNGPKSVSPIPCNTLQNTDSASPSSTPGNHSSLQEVIFLPLYQFKLIKLDKSIQKSH